MTRAVRLGENPLIGPPELWRIMTKRLVMTMSTIALAVTGALIPNAAFADDGTESLASSDRGTSGEYAHTDRGTSWESYLTLRRGTSWE
jgi:hypothetical protein